MRESCVQSCASGQLYGSGMHGNAWETWIRMQSQIGRLKGTAQYEYG